MNQVRLKRLFDSVSGGSWGVEPEEGEVNLPCIRGTDFDYQVLRVTTRRAPVRGFSSHEVAKRGARRGDIIIEKSGGGEQQPVGRAALHDSDDIVMPTNFAARLSPSADSDARFLTYLLSSLYAIGATRSSIKQTTGIQNLDLHSFLDTVVHRPSLQAQRAIADFLDAETARIDALIAKKRRLKALLEDRYWNWVSDRVRRASAPTVQLRRALVSITDGPFGSSLTSNHYSDAGARVVRLGNIGMAKFKDEDKAYVSTEHYATLLKHRVRSGDLLIAGLGDANNHVGRGCVAPELGPAIVKADCYCATVDQCRASAHFLALYLASPLGRSAVANLSRGSTRTRINLDVAKSVPVILPPLSEQRAIVIEAGRRRQTNLSLHVALDHQVELLLEHRQALITAAVTGQIEVPEAAASHGSGW